MTDQAIFTPAIDRWVRAATLLLTLVLCCLVGLVTPYVASVIGLIVALAVLLRGKLFEAYRALPSRMFLIAFVTLGALFAITAKTPMDTVFTLNFLSFVLFGPLALLLGRGAAQRNGVRFAQLTTLGAAVALGTALVARYGLNLPRAQMPNFGAILLANTAILLGFLGLTGLVAPGARWRIIYLSGPLFAFAAVVLTESRGPVLGIVPLVLVCIVGIAAAVKSRPLWVLLVGFAIVGGLLAGAGVVLQGRLGTLFQMLSQVTQGGAIADLNALIRLHFYGAAFGALEASPIVGHGWANMMGAITPYIAEDYLKYAASLPQLHNDIVDFAVAGGLVGVGVYLLLLITPLLAALRSEADSLKPLRILAVTILVTTYVFAGLTDLMFGFEFHTWLYVSVSAIILAWCREPEPVAAPG